ncbi:MAG: MGH1-like glycoside hydrolase domain-containing protein [Chloroflexota bacterium]
MSGVERTRMEDAGHPENGWREASPWYQWGPYLAERAWGSVREDYTAGGDAWASFPHDHARSRAYRWNEDGMAGLTDVFNRLSLSLALWNGVDPILKERMFGLAGPEGNHGEDVKDYWWYLDALPSGSWLRWRYHYPQAAFPYEDLVRTNAARSKLEPEYELIDTGVFDEDRYWIVEVHYAKESPTDILMRVTVRNRGPETATLHVLPTLWFRNEWNWNPAGGKPGLAATAGGSRIEAHHADLGEYVLEVGPNPDGTRPELLFCENETNLERIDGSPNATPYPKDGINDHVISKAGTVNTAGTGTKAAAWYRLTVPAGETAEVRLRLHRADEAPGNGVATSDVLGTAFEQTMRRREAEADEFYAELRRDDTTDEEARIMRQAFAGMLWSKQYYGYNVARWLDGDPGLPPPPPERKQGRNADWRHFDAADIMSMPDPWEYPWFAAWDLAFHAVTLAHVDPAFAKYQLLLLCREWFQHPHGALPAYEWSFDDVNPPVHAAAAYMVFAIDGRRDYQFLRRVFHKLLLNFTWWLNREDKEGNDLFSGGFLGLDNIGAFDRSHLPLGTELEQSDATAWMFQYCITMLRIATVLSEHDPTYEDFQTTFMEHAVRIGTAMNRSGLWDETDGFFYDALKLADGSSVPIKVHSMVGLIPLLPVASIQARIVRRSQALGKRFASFMEGLDLTGESLREGGYVTGRPGHEFLQLSVVPPARLGKLLGEMLSEDGFLSPHGLRALSRRHRDQPFRLDLGGLTAEVDYEPGESKSGLFGGNSNWRGPVWMPTNYMVILSLWNWDSFMGDGFLVEYPTGSGTEVRLRDVSDDLARRLVSIWLPDEKGRRPVFGTYEKFQTDPEWRDLLWFHEYFHGDTGAGLGASHQTGWTGLVAHLLCRDGLIDAIRSGRGTARLGGEPPATGARVD